MIFRIAPERGERPASSPQVAHIVRNAVLLQQRKKLVLKRHAAMMLLLSGDVFRGVGRARAADTECSVPSLPRESPPGGKLLMHPPRRIGFHHSQQFRDGLVRGKGHQQVHVIRRTVDDQRDALSLPDNTAHVLEKAVGDLARQIRGTVFCGEDNVNQQRSKTVCHKTYAPFRGSALPRPDSARLTPWATIFRPPGLPSEPNMKQWSASH